MHVSDTARQEALQLAESLRRKGIRDERVLQAIATVPRERFVPADEQTMAYQDIALPLKCGQTVSQPYIVALMTEALAPRPTDTILEIGGGSGYQAAILSQLVDRVITVERIPELAEEAEQRLRSLGIGNVEVHVGDGTLGWPPEAPYDGIIVTAAAPKLPQPLLEQLKPGRHLVIPVGDEWLQRLVRVRRDGDILHEEPLCDCRFVKLVGRYGWPET
ncbi:MAG: protein-L-isoaspartate(D-aspartate) O-methyltransferase [Planctomycetota bacterium]|nr:MAG: protein-L-isoaspartate(D-aspartate) O-methyltransferase [Planctomycetota bacterium]